MRVRIPEAKRWRCKIRFMGSREQLSKEQIPKEDSSPPSYKNIQAPKKLTSRNIRDHLSGLVVSVILHIIAITFLCTIIVFKTPDEGKDIEVTEVEVKIKEIEKIPEPPEPEEVVLETELEIERPDVTVEDSEVVVEDVVIDAPDVDVIMPNILSVEPTNSALTMPTLFGMRTRSGRKVALKRYGGNNRTEKAVMNALHWLKDHQNPDGSWGNRTQSSGITGLALLAFLAHGETPSSTEFGNCVLKAIKKLIDFLGPEVEIKIGHLSPYKHGIVMYALSEAYAVTQIQMLKNVVNKGISYIIRGQNSDGSYDYSYKNSGRSDLSIAGFQYQALKAAFAAGSTAKGLKECIDKAINIGLKKTHAIPIGFCYSVNDGKKKRGDNNGSMTAVGTLCLQLFGEGRCQQAQTGLKTLESKKNFWFSWKGKGKTRKDIIWSLYRWYYQTQAIFQGHSGKGEIWKRWNRMFTGELLKRQKEDGHWESPAHLAKIKSEGEGGTYVKGMNMMVYSTSLCCLMLEVYYRYLPTFKLAEHKSAIKFKKRDEDDDSELQLQ